VKRSPMGMVRPRSDTPQRDELPIGSGAELIQRIAESINPRKPGFRYYAFSETRLLIFSDAGSSFSAKTSSRQFVNRGGNPSQSLTALLFAVMVTVVGWARKRKQLMTIEKVIGRTLAGQPKKTPETTFGVAQVFVLMLLVGFVAFTGAVLLLLIAII
jgi:hypothetical protein